ncbi:2-isopropylmalate synthase [Aureliella helgolandensis]|uniref:2-isopropylmalate synthase n=1 Tax=Aureliella helgolandensis TaxID=2527968 RepID=A0A518GGQ3_9BACT|nr:2-isopropylmalate synthase [Aureliella helgolandensis]QDV27776.1 2-isopropylmalate synthase [Aureliella helgolandensis]
MPKYVPFQPLSLPDRTWPNQTIRHAPVWCSVDLRDGNQALINPMGPAKKMELFKTLLRIGFKEIEVGFPAASETDFSFLRELIEQQLIPDDVTIQVLTQARPQLIERTFEAIAGAKNAIVHLYNSTSTLQRRVVFRADKAEITKLAVDGATRIHELASQVSDGRVRYQYSPESFTGTEIDFSVEICDAVCNVWQPTIENKTIINLPSTVELATPNVYADQIELFCRLFKFRDRAIISLHTHNDRGTGVAASELALLAGADRVEGTLFGNGERTGNLDIVTMALNLTTQGIDSGLDFSNIKEVRRVAEFCTELKVHERTPYAGDLVFTAFSGSHQDAIKKGYDAMKESGQEQFEVPYLTIDPADIGRQYDPIIRVNSQSGKGGVAYLVENELGFRLPRRLQVAFSQVVQQATDSTGQEMPAREVGKKFLETYVSPPAELVYRSHKPLECDLEDQEMFQFSIEYQGVAHEVVGQGNGPLDALVHALTEKFGLAYDIQDYQEHAMEAGSGSSAAAYILLKTPEGTELYGVGQHRSLTKASILGLVAAINRCLGLSRDATSKR